MMLISFVDFYWKFRHLRAYLRPEPIKLIMWGNIETEMFSVHAHLNQDDIINEVMSHYGTIPQTKINDSKARDPKQCMICSTVCAPNSHYCQSCDEPLTEKRPNGLHARPEDGDDT